MITIENYFSEFDKLSKGNTLPEALQKGAEFVEKVTLERTSWTAYNTSGTIKKTIDLYLERLNEYAASLKQQDKKETPKVKAKKAVPKKQATTAKKPKAASKKKPKKAKAKPKKKQAKPSKPKTRNKTLRELAYERAEKVERVSDALKLIKRFVLMHDKVKTRHQVRLFINALQRAIAEKRIGKTSSFAKDIMDIQDDAIKLYGRFKTETESIHVKIGDRKRSRYLTLIGKQTELYSVKFIKSYIGLQGKRIENKKARNLHNRIAKAINNGKLTKKDRYWKEIENILSNLKTFVKKNKSEGELLVSSKELNGLQGIVNGCGCKELNGIGDTPDIDAHRHTIMNSTDIVNLDFEKLGFTGKWLELIGDPSGGFTTMIFGKPKMGKSYLAVDFAGYLARNHGTVLYIAKEEGIDDTLQQKLKDKNVAHPDLYVSDYLPQDLSLYDFVFLDSVTKLRLNPQKLEELKHNNPHISFIYIFQTTKMGNFRGANEFQHDVDVVIEVPEQGKAIQFGRFNQGGAIDIFDE